MTQTKARKTSTLSLRAALLTSCLLASGGAFAQDAGEGFLIRVNGAPVGGDPRIERQAKRADVQLAKADVRIQYDGLDVTPRLDIEAVGNETGFRAGQTVTLQSALNYPGFVRRGEVRILDLNARGGPKLLARSDIAPNGQISLTMPEGNNIAVVHRVYDDRGRYDETAPLVLSRGDARNLADGVEDGNDSAVRRGIPVYGGAVTISGNSVPQGARVQTLGENVRPDPSGKFVLQRILPPGQHAVDVGVTGAGQNIDIVREVDVPAADWFYVGQAEVTLGWRDSDLDGEDTYTTGRIAGYIKGRRANGVEITGQVDTGEGDLSDIFRDLDERDPRSVLLRVDPDDLYPTYGDDSTIVDDTPTSGKLYVRIEKENNYVVWGDWRAGLGGEGYLRNDRTLYGLRTHLETGEVTSKGEARFSFDAYAAQPERVPVRDVFRGTGGSVYFLRRQDIGIASETISIQVRDASTGRVIETRRLVAGRDYDINYIQGIVTLARPLQSGTGSNGLVQTEINGAADVNLVVQYEYTPTGTDIDDFAYGLRGEGWLTDRLRFGATYMTEERDAGDQSAYGVDLLYHVNDETFLRLEYAESDGPGFSSNVSTDGGFAFSEIAAVAGSGEAVSVEGRAALRDLGWDRDGSIRAYFEERTAGFSTQDYTTSSDETLYGLAFDVQVSDRTRLSFYYDDYENDAGEIDREGGAEVEYQVSDTVALGFGVESLERRGGSDDGRRTDAALRLTMTPNDELTYYAFAQTTLDHSGNLPENDRYGIGGQYTWDTGWSLEGEISDGDLGAGARILVRNEKENGDSVYFGYELDQSREIAGLSQSETGRDQGRYIVGGERKISEKVSMFGENTYDTFGRYKSLSSAYGVTYDPTTYVSYLTAFEYGTVRDDINGDFDRRAVSFGVRYEDIALTASARLEYRTEDRVSTTSPLDSKTLLVAGTASYKIDDDQRLVFKFLGSDTNSDGGIVEEGDLLDLSLGYAYRPVANERLNLLLQYRYLDDSYGQQLDNDDDRGPIQKSHVFSIDADYDLTERWTVGGKLGMRLSESGPADGSTPMVDNDAILAVLNARYHLPFEWDMLFELRSLELDQAGTTEIGALGAVYKHVGQNVKLGVGYNFGTFSDDLTDLTYDDKGAFINIIAKF
ncbi:hypothetical protein [Nereida sp. MMG025]|uniref:hypothetical protein n=1 Tax=Nereida sp. MMG025 TaxID=2909981 RepID=UPI001F332006|nr:hypothetical protein [Nereida sp. MMG025]MCF6443303.1 hypothetical protein [Nereida sp. MMG025]